MFLFSSKCQSKVENIIQQIKKNVNNILNTNINWFHNQNVPD